MLKVKFDFSLPNILSFVSSLFWGACVYEVWKQNGPVFGVALAILAIIVNSLAKILLESLMNGKI